MFAYGTNSLILGTFLSLPDTVLDGLVERGGELVLGSDVSDENWRWGEQG
jgi:hypothetical protein